MQFHSSPRYLAAALLVLMFTAVVLFMLPGDASGEDVFYEIRAREETNHRFFNEDDSGRYVYYALYKDVEYALDAQEKMEGGKEYIWDFGDGTTHNTTKAITYWIFGNTTYSSPGRLQLTLSDSSEEKGPYVAEYKVFDLPEIYFTGMQEFGVGFPVGKAVGDQGRVEHGLNSHWPVSRYRS